MTIFFSLVFYILLEFYNFFLFPVFNLKFTFFYFYDLVCTFSKNTSIIFSKFLYAFLNDRDSDFLIKDFVFTFFIYLLLFVFFSLIVFINEELSTSVFEVFFDTFFFTWFIFYFPDFFVYGFNSFNNKFGPTSLSFSSFFIPFVEFFSGLLKSFILSVRLNTNYISGHLMFSLVFLVFELFLFLNLHFSFLFLKFILLFIYLLEFCMIIAQFYVLILLVLTYVKQSYY